MGSGDHSQAGQRPEVGADCGRVHVQDVGDFAFSDGLVEPKQQHEQDDGFLEAAEKFHFFGMEL